MKVSKTLLTGCLTIGSIGLAATSASACHGGSKYGGYSSYSSHYSPRYVERVYVQEQPTVTTLPFAPAHSVVVVMPGDSWPALCAREYGNPGLWGQVAAFNGVPQNVQLNPGMQLRLPVIHPNGSFSLSSAPAMTMPPQGFAGGIPGGIPGGAPQGMPQGMPQGFAQGMPQGLPQGIPQGSPQVMTQGFPQGISQGLPQGMPQGAQPGLPQGMQAGPQAGMPAMNGSVQQVQGFDPQQGPVGPRAPEAVANDTSSMVQRLAEQLMSPPGMTNGTPAMPNAGPTDRPLPSIVIGSIMTINGQPLGEGRGTVRLVVNGSPVPLEIVEWTASSAKVRIPADLPAGIQVQIEILRADGSVVAKDNVQLAAGQSVAAANR